MMNEEFEQYNEKMISIWGKRAAELAEIPDVQEKMIKIKTAESKEAAEKFLYMLAAATLCGV